MAEFYIPFLLWHLNKATSAGLFSQRNLKWHAKLEFLTSWYLPIAQNDGRNWIDRSISTTFEFSSKPWPFSSNISKVKTGHLKCPTLGQKIVSWDYHSRKITTVPSGRHRSHCWNLKFAAFPHGLTKQATGSTGSTVQIWPHRCGNSNGGSHFEPSQILWFNYTGFTQPRNHVNKNQWYHHDECGQQANLRFWKQIVMIRIHQLGESGEMARGWLQAPKIEFWRTGYTYVNLYQLALVTKPTTGWGRVLWPGPQSMVWRTSWLCCCGPASWQMFNRPESWYPMVI